MKNQENTKFNQKKIYLADYKPSFFTIENVSLEIYVDLYKTRVISTYQVELKNCSKNETHDLVLDGRNLKLVNIFVNNKQIYSNKYILTDESLTIPRFSGGQIKVQTTINPSKNMDLSGLYASESGLYTQCEAEGFRHITYFIDRPDILSKYIVHIHADREKFPVLLSNGNLIQESYDKRTGILSRIWEDPFPKPCYLFALVAANLAVLEEKIIVGSGREVLLQFYTKKVDINKVFHGLKALKSAIRWDENRNNLELDLNRYMVVAVPDFNSGAMENKGLNLFNTKYILADKDISTDQDYESIRAVIGHEYFHNWTGNRITCRDWFQLTLKEGLTVFREQEFITDFNAKNLSEYQSRSAKAVKRIEDVQIIREKQFPEDASPMAHPIRPNSYSEIRNFYTTTIYEKGAEVIRMLHTIFGENGFQKGMYKYINDFDGSAATCEDFVNSILQANDREDLFHIFMRWYDSKGTPSIDIKEKWNPDSKTFTVTFEQKNSRGSIEIKPLLIPIKYKFLNAEKFSFPITEQLFLLKESKKTLNFRFPSSPPNEKPHISLFRNFSSPVNIIRKLSPEEYLFQMQNDCDLFNKWDAAQKLYLMAFIEKDPQKEKKFTTSLTNGLRNVLGDTSISEAFKALMLTPPKDSFISEKLVDQKRLIDPKFIFYRRTAILKSIALALREEFHISLNKVSQNTPSEKYEIDPISIGKRKLKNLLQMWLSQLDPTPKWKLTIKDNFFKSTNMTDRVEALKSLLLIGNSDCRDALKYFYKKFQGNPIALDKWICLQIEFFGFFSYNNVKVLNLVEGFLKEDFFITKNPNRVYAVLGTFFFKNLNEFHCHDESYELWVKEILLLDKHNPQLAARLTRSFDSWKNFVPKCQNNMKKSLDKLSKYAKSKDVLEVTSRLLENN